MRLETLNKLDESPEIRKHYSKYMVFIARLSGHIPLSHIDVNDWQCNLKPSVYIHGKKNMFKMARYYACRKGDEKKAIKFYQSN